MIMGFILLKHLPRGDFSKQDQPRQDFLVWLKNSWGFVVSEKLKYFNADELMEGPTEKISLGFYHLGIDFIQVFFYKENRSAKTYKGKKQTQPQIKGNVCQK